LKKGFTLVELLVVIAIVSLLTTVSVATITSVKQKRQTKVAAEQVKNVLSEAHAYAISPKTDAPTGPVNITIASDQRTIEAKIGGVSVAGPVTVSSGITLTCSANPCFSFKTSDSNTIGQLKSGDGKIFAKKGTGEPYTITVSKLSGNVIITTP